MKLCANKILVLSIFVHKLKMWLWCIQSTGPNALSSDEILNWCTMGFLVHELIIYFSITSVNFLVKWYDTLIYKQWLTKYLRLSCRLMMPLTQFICSSHGPELIEYNIHTKTEGFHISSFILGERDRRRERETEAKVPGFFCIWSMKKPALGVPCTCWLALGHRLTWKPMYRGLWPISQSSLGGRVSSTHASMCPQWRELGPQCHSVDW